VTFWILTLFIHWNTLGQYKPGTYSIYLTAFKNKPHCDKIPNQNARVKSMLLRMQPPNRNSNCGHRQYRMCLLFAQDGNRYLPELHYTFIILLILGTELDILPVSVPRSFRFGSCSRCWNREFIQTTPGFGLRIWWLFKQTRQWFVFFCWPFCTILNTWCHNAMCWIY